MQHCHSGNLLLGFLHDKVHNSRPWNCLVQCRLSAAVAECINARFGRPSAAAAQAKNKKNAQDLCVCQAYAAAELDTICLPQCKLSAAVADYINAWTGRTSFAISPAPTNMNPAQKVCVCQAYAAAEHLLAAV